MSLITVATELSLATGITQMQAEAVLNHLHFNQLDQHRLAMKQVVNDPNAVKVLNMTTNDRTNMSTRVANDIVLADLRLAMATFQGGHPAAASAVAGAMVA